ncbi:Bacteriophage holin family protein [anaerobic digester metagenome]
MKTSEISLVFALAGGLLGRWLGGWDGFLQCLVAFVVLDYFTGVLCAIQDKKLESAQGFRGILKKALIFMVVGIGHLLDITLLGGAGAPLRVAMIGFYLSNEGLSILENLGRLGVPLPGRLKQVIKELGEAEEKQQK